MRGLIACALACALVLAAAPSATADGAMIGDFTMRPEASWRFFTDAVIGDERSRHLVILMPGGFDGFFADMAAGRFRIPDDMPAIEESARRHYLSFTGPPLE